jgi:Putative amidoligase enzyme
VEDDDSLQVPTDERAELVSPILVETDIDLLIRIIDAVRIAGATVNSHCGVHVHIGAATCTVEHLNTAIDVLIVLEPIVIERMLGINEHRRRFAGLMSKDFIDQFKANRPTTLKQLWALWGGPDYDERRRSDRFDVARYQGFNLHSHAFRGTIEFRYFNGTVDSQRIVEYVRLCLGVAEQAGFPVPSQEDS